MPARRKATAVAALGTLPLALTAPAVTAADPRRLPHRLP